jgi:hypothetical protein
MATKTEIDTARVLYVATDKKIALAMRTYFTPWAIGTQYGCFAGNLLDKEDKELPPEIVPLKKKLVKHIQLNFHHSRVSDFDLIIEH